MLHLPIFDAASLSGKIYFHGQGDFFEIWPFEDVEEHFDEDQAELTRLVLLKMTLEAKRNAGHAPRAEAF